MDDLTPAEKLFQSVSGDKTTLSKVLSQLLGIPENTPTNTVIDVVNNLEANHEGKNEKPLDTTRSK